MLWTQWLQSLGGEFDLGEVGRAHVLSWNYNANLPDNAPHRHTFFEICSVGAHGRGEFRVQDVPHIVESSDTFFARPGVVHQIVNLSEPLMELFWVSFALEDRSEIARDFCSGEILVARDESLNSIWNALRSAGESRAPFPVMRHLASALLGSIVVAGASQRENAFAVSLPDARSHLTQLAVRYIHDNLAKKMTLPEIAAHIHVSPRQLVRLFALFVGTSPAAYIERARLDRAESLLLRSSKPLKVVASEVGFPDVAHFSRVFARRSGNPPGDFRKRGLPLKKTTSGPNIQKSGELV